MSSGLMAYGTEYGSDTRTQTPGAGSYNAGMMMYNVPHNTAAQQSVFDTQQFTPRQHAAMQMMPSDVASTYFTSDATGSSGTPIQQPGQISSTSPNVYQQQPPSVAYTSSMANVSDIHHQSSSSRAGASESHGHSSDDGATEKWTNFRRQLGIVFQDINSGQLERASETLLSISNWMLSQVVELGLHQDNPVLHEDRLKLWNDFNHAWLALSFQQKELMASGQSVSRSQRLMSEDTVKKMGDELIRLCDGIERHGLVDYQYGVWEEQIEAVLEDCLDLFDNEEDTPR
ncbi:hypothetical protein QQS21_004524 [Conoideocrella luteorostrata]|uniref:Uncharacterized protein n=1 Tax=Conoideocrella luteorostrata TaxID=1105319 RepID=A0AAJ0FUL8_9HYPO|nr:hypothetical protein QQS21_004524 [Conoideocrella luteorostrata]